MPRLLASEGRNPNRSVEFELGDLTLSEHFVKNVFNIGLAEVARRQNSSKSSPTFSLTVMLFNWPSRFRRGLPFSIGF